MLDLEFHEVDTARWVDFELLFESRGGPKSCWCMVWRQGAKTTKGPDRKVGMQKFVGDGIPIGLLGYSEGNPVAWCSIAPKETYRDFGATEYAGDSSEHVWSLACFFVRRELRGQGLAKQIIEASVLHAKKNGATIVEAYPVDPSSPSYRFMGFVETFAAAGFHEIGLAGSRRHVMQRKLR
jgi:GNAT superfamily N-acetyltransferase